MAKPHEMAKDKGFGLDKTYTVHLKPGGEICNRLARGIFVIPLKQKEGWVQITWRKGKKKGWIYSLTKDD